MGDYWNDLDHHPGGDLMRHFWMSHPSIRRYINQSVTGDPNVWPLEWFCEHFTRSRSLESAVSVGCGTGSFERELVKRGAVKRIVAIDAQVAPLEVARELAAAAGFSGTIDYVQADAREFLKKSAGQFDGIFFHGSLHHFDRMSELLIIIRKALADDGLLFADEYIGPSMSEYSWRHLLGPNLAYRTVPKKLRRPRIVRSPLNRDDPSEAIDSSSIGPAIEGELEVLARRDYGGNLLSLLYPNLRKPGEGAVTEAELTATVERLIEREKRLLASGAKPFHALIVARRKSRRAS